MGWRMRAVLVGVAVAAMVLPLVAASSSTTRAASEDGVWVLEEVIVETNDDRWADANEHDSYEYQTSAAVGSLSVTTRYVGPDDDQFDPPMVHGEGITLHGSFSAPGSRLVPGGEVSVDLRLSASDNTLSGFAFHANGWVETFFIDEEGEWVAAGPRLAAPDGSSTFTIGQEVRDYTPISVVVSAVVPEGREDRRWVVRQYFGAAAPLSVDFVYRWGGAGDEPVVVPEPMPTPVCPVPRGQDRPWVTPSTERPGQVYSGAGFSDLHGGVYVIPGDDPTDYYSAQLNSVLWVDDEVETRERSGAILSLRDMTTFVMRENSLIRIGDQSEEENKLKLLFGHVWVNVCQIIEDGSMDIEMSQIAMGIKGTTLVLSDDGVTSSVMVFEGEVEVTSHATGGSVVVSGGEMVDATAEGLGVVSVFDVDAELGNWDEQVRGWTHDAMAIAAVDAAVDPAGADPAGVDAVAWREGGGWWPWVVVIGVAVLVAGAVLVLVRRRGVVGVG